MAKSNPKTQILDPQDPVLSMLGVGKQLWKTEAGDKFVDRLRSEELPLSPLRANTTSRKPASSVWRRIETHQGQEFLTATGLPFTYELEGSGIWFFRGGRRINRKLTRSQVEVAISRCPLATTTEIKDLMDYPYLFSLLTDSRIKGQSW